MPSELCTDLANDLLHAVDWDPREIFSPHAKNMPEPILLDDMIPYGQAAEVDVDLEADKFGRADDFMDDGMIIVPDIDDIRLQGAGALPLAMHILCRPLASDEPVLRDDPLSLSKLSEEGALAKILIMLGWLFNQSLLTIALPKDKKSSLGF